jgi:uncharacterized damage-inducible protein DinB
VKPWFERKFVFGFAPELFPNLCSRLRGTPARLEELVANAEARALVQKRGDQWSAQEHAGHLLDMEDLWLARLQDYLAARTSMTPADLSNTRTNEAQHNDRPVSNILQEFRRKRNALVQVAENLDPVLLSSTLVHPRMQAHMSLPDHLFFVAEHDDHHLAYIWGLLASQSSSIS